MDRFNTEQGHIIPGSSYIAGYNVKRKRTTTVLMDIIKVQSSQKTMQQQGSSIF